VAGVASGCCGSGLGTGTELAGAPSADSGSPLATGTTSGRGMVLATSLDSRGLCYCRRRLQFFDLDGDGREGTATRLAGLAKTDVQTVLA